MNKSKATLLLVVAVAALGTLVSCGSGSSSGMRAETVYLPNGSVVVCVTTYGGGVDCDWDSAR